MNGVRANEIAIWRRRAELGLPSDAKTGAKSCVERTRRPRPCRDPMGAATRAELAWNSLFKNGFFTPVGRPAGHTIPLPIIGGVSEAPPSVFPAVGCGSRRRPDGVSHMTQPWAHLPAGGGDGPRKHRRCREASGSILRRPRPPWKAGSTHGAQTGSPGSIRGYRARSAVSFNQKLELTIPDAAQSVAAAPLCLLSGLAAQL